MDEMNETNESDEKICVRNINYYYDGLWRAARSTLA